MILLITVITIVVLVILLTTNTIENYKCSCSTDRTGWTGVENALQLNQKANNICRDGYTLSNCVTSTPIILPSNVLQRYGTTCQCIGKSGDSYNVYF